MILAEIFGDDEDVHAPSPASPPVANRTGWRPPSSPTCEAAPIPVTVAISRRWQVRDRSHDGILGARTAADDGGAFECPVADHRQQVGGMGGRDHLGSAFRGLTFDQKAMAHMPDRAKRIDISPECEVRMLTTDGSDLHRIDKSAGASQALPGRTDGNPPSASALLHLFQPFPVHLPPLYLRHPQTMFIQQLALNRPGNPGDYTR